MTSRYDELSPRARWFMENFDEIDLADICASQEAAKAKLEAELTARDAALAACTAQLVHDQAALAAAKKCARGIGARGVLQAIDNASAPAPDDGPTVAEAAADDEAHWQQRQWDGRA